MDINYRIGRAYDPKTWNCAHCVADYFQQRHGTDMLPDTEGPIWDKEFMYWIRRYFKSEGAFRGDWRNHIGEMLTCRTTGGRLHVGVVMEQGIYHAYSGNQVTGGDTVITAFELFPYRDVRFFSWKG